MKAETRAAVLVAAGWAGLALGAGFAAGWAAGGGMGRAAVFPAPSGHGPDAGVALSPAGQRVASGLKCPCGCPDLLLACGCANPRGAVEVKRRIMELLANGRSESEARIEVINRYGAAIQRIAR